MDLRTERFTSLANVSRHSLTMVAAAALLAVVVMGFYLATKGTMLILRGVASADAPQGQLDEGAARLYALLRGYRGEIIDAPGDAGGPQVKLALERIRTGSDVNAIYGFSGGGFNAVAILGQLKPDERKRIREIVVVGSPGITPASFPGVANVVVKEDPPEGHLEGPRALLKDGPSQTK